ncbi:hypothetical protein KUTeg_011754 [Tegillarca granosa]|uniref:Uncharacterized protein n=1 Tax=Tegillarca granosa TaxID=220873 RepID=A0ABQ9EXJ6_TEGGR|nr:hypothetical protein KUTeg_011754 [Tegillarca granosa]
MILSGKDRYNTTIKKCKELSHINDADELEKLDKGGLSRDSNLEDIYLIVPSIKQVKSLSVLKSIGFTSFVGLFSYWLFREQERCPYHKLMDTFYKNHKTSILSPSRMKAMDDHFSNALGIFSLFSVDHGSCISWTPVKFVLGVEFEDHSSLDQFMSSKSHIS